MVRQTLRSPRACLSVGVRLGVGKPAEGPRPQSVAHKRGGVAGAALAISPFHLSPLTPTLYPRAIPRSHLNTLSALGGSHAPAPVHCSLSTVIYPLTRRRHPGLLSDTPALWPKTTKQMTSSPT